MRARLQTKVPAISERLARSMPLIDGYAEDELLRTPIEKVLAAIEHSANGRDPRGYRAESTCEMRSKVPVGPLTTLHTPLTSREGGLRAYYVATSMLHGLDSVSSHVSALRRISSPRGAHTRCKKQSVGGIPNLLLEPSALWRFR